MDKKQACSNSNWNPSPLIMAYHGIYSICSILILFYVACYSLFILDTKSLFDKFYFAFIV